jgi:hypothetical protein
LNEAETRAEHIDPALGDAANGANQRGLNPAYALEGGAFVAPVQ